MTSIKFHLATCVRNEGPYLLDWVLYHRTLGFHQITVYSNDNTDDSNPLLEALQKKGLITWIDRQMAEGESPQLTAYQDLSQKLFLSEQGALSYLAWLDVDEYLVLKKDASLQALLERYRCPDALLVNWMHFGSAGKTHWENTATPLRFCHRAEKTALDKHFKSISKINSNIFRVLNNHRPILKPQAVARIIYAADGESDLMPLDEVIKGQNPVLIPDAPVCHSVCYLAHYATRSREEFLWKQARGNGRLPLNSEKKHFLGSYFPQHDLNDVHDTFAASKFSEVVGRLSNPDYSNLVNEFGPLAAQTIPSFSK
ncbi:MAG: glycosyltransferase family 2 protein [Burkholderiales bacterium]|jgi:hypothetical protein|nr:glycosyltransferase family 2 protein [Burkholderiales bacterium]